MALKKWWVLGSLFTRGRDGWQTKPASIHALELVDKWAPRPIRNKLAETATINGRSTQNLLLQTLAS